jgi:hypothetical protein
LLAKQAGCEGSEVLRSSGLKLKLPAASLKKDE